MKTYATFSAIAALLIFGCSKSNEDPIDEAEKTNTAVSYVALLSKDDKLKPQLLNANAESITFNLSGSSLSENTIPELSYVEGSNFLQYYKDGNCGGQVSSHDFKNDATIDLAVFTDLNDCDLTATAIAKSGNYLFISYALTGLNSNDYLVRTVDLSAAEFNTLDINLNKKPVGLTVANNRLFILTFDESVTDENSLSVLNFATNELIHEMDLGYDVRRIFTDSQDNVIISYDELHTTLDSSTMAFEYTQYNSNTEPKFATSETSYLALDGRLFYPMNPGVNSSYSLVPAIYDFAKNLVVVYAYENFLTEEKRNFEYEIETTTAVAYDEKNGVMLVGYKKKENSIKEGGLLRIRLEPEPALIDNIDLEGFPVEIIMN